MVLEHTGFGTMCFIRLLFQCLCVSKLLVPDFGPSYLEENRRDINKTCTSLYIINMYIPMHVHPYDAS